MSAALPIADVVMSQPTPNLSPTNSDSSLDTMMSDTVDLSATLEVAGANQPLRRYKGELARVGFLQTSRFPAKRNLICCTESLRMVRQAYLPRITHAHL